ncbi:MAG: O-antigen ligase family protein [Limnothrix sp. CACIAM 69d]|nr:MAG: O-antigen ligase family protein [Limnothrix sp. CACIAM 69d]
MGKLAALGRVWLGPTRSIVIDPALLGPWAGLWWGLLVLPLSPALGAVAIGLGIIATYWQRWDAIRRDRLVWAWGAIGLVMLLSLPGSPNLERAALGLANFLPFFWAFGAFSQLITHRSHLRPLAQAIVWGCLPAVGLGLGQLFGGWRGPVRIVPVIDWILAAGGNPPGRLSSAFEYANVTASYFGVALVLALGLLVMDGERWRRAQTHRSTHAALGWGVILGNGLSVLLLLGAIGLTDSRSGWALAAIDLLAAGLYVGWFWLLALAGGAIALVLGAAFGPEPAAGPLRAIVPKAIWGRLNDALYPDRPEATLRRSQWDFAWNLAAQRPWTGWGLGNFTGLYERATGNWLGHPHNLALMLAMETGWPAALGLIGLCGWIMAQFTRAIGRWGDRDSQTRLAAWGLGFANLAAYHLLDVTLFDLRVNLLGWVLLAGMHGLLKA